jgi:hypothetical protein
MKLANQDIREAAKKAGVRLWQIADALNLFDGNLSRKLRHELPQTEKDKLFAIIEQLAAEQEAQP